MSLFSEEEKKIGQMHNVHHQNSMLGFSIKQENV